MTTTDNSSRLAAARGNAVYGGRLSSLGASGGPIMTHALTARSDGRPSWIGRPKWAITPFSPLDENGVDVIEDQMLALDSACTPSTWRTTMDKRFTPRGLIAFWRCYRMQWKYLRKSRVTRRSAALTAWNVLAWHRRKRSTRTQPHTRGDTR